jgi:hypothetical protein
MDCVVFLNTPMDIRNDCAYRHDRKSQRLIHASKIAGAAWNPS